MGADPAKGLGKFMFACAIVPATIIAGISFYAGYSKGSEPDRSGITVSFNALSSNPHNTKAAESFLAAKVNEYFTARGLPVDPVKADGKVGDTLARAKGPQP